MTAKQLCFILLIVTLFFQNCASDNKKTAQQSSPTTTAAPASNEPTASTEPVSAETQEKKESPIGKSVEELREKKPGRIGTVPIGKDAELNHAIPAPPIKVKKSEPSAGPTAYTNKANVMLQSEPSKDASKTRSFKIYEQVIILETKMTDDAGNATPFPKWYKVQCSDKKEGWVVASSITLN